MYQQGSSSKTHRTTIQCNYKGQKIFCHHTQQNESKENELMLITQISIYIQYYVLSCLFSFISLHSNATIWSGVLKCISNTAFVLQSGPKDDVTKLPSVKLIHCLEKLYNAYEDLNKVRTFSTVADLHYKVLVVILDMCVCVRVCGDVKWFGHWPSIMERSQVQFPVWNFGVVARILLKILQCTKLYKL